MLVARNIEALMKHRGLDGAKLSRLAGLNPTGIYDIISGKSKSPRIETIDKIARGLGVPIAAIFSENVPLDPQDELESVFGQLTAERRDLLLQAARAWLAESAA